MRMRKREASRADDLAGMASGDQTLKTQPRRSSSSLVTTVSYATYTGAVTGPAASTLVSDDAGHGRRISFVWLLEFASRRNLEALPSIDEIHFAAGTREKIAQDNWPVYSGFQFHCPHNAHVLRGFSAERSDDFLLFRHADVLIFRHQLVGEDRRVLLQVKRPQATVADPEYTAKDLQFVSARSCSAKDNG